MILLNIGWKKDNIAQQNIKASWGFELLVGHCYPHLVFYGTGDALINPEHLLKRTKIKSIMAAYVIVEVTVNNQEEYEEYKKLTPATLAAYNGKFIVRGGETETLEGDWQPERIVVLEFPTVELAKEWWNSDIYSEAKVIRQRTAKTKMIVVQGA